MHDPQDSNSQSKEIAAELSQLIEQSLDQQRALWHQAARYSRDESLRFATLRLKRANHALENVQNKDGFQIMVQIHQAWLHDFVQDYASQSVRYGEIMSRLTASAMAHAIDAASEAMEANHDALRQGGEAAVENLDILRESGADIINGSHEAADVAAESTALPSQEYH
jgi:hypothetical protein